MRFEREEAAGTVEAMPSIILGFGGRSLKRNEEKGGNRQINLEVLMYV